MATSWMGTPLHICMHCTSGLGSIFACYTTVLTSAHRGLGGQRGRGWLSRVTGGRSEASGDVRERLVVRVGGGGGAGDADAVSVVAAAVAAVLDDDKDVAVMLGELPGGKGDSLVLSGRNRAVREAEVIERLMVMYTGLGGH